MDISIIDTSKVDQHTGIIVGDIANQPAVIEYLNLACPYCRQWFNDSKETLAQALKEKQAYRVIKLFNKEKESLKRGNIMHQYIAKFGGKQALADIQAILDSQEEWKNLPLDEVEIFARQVLHLTKQVDTGTADKIITEATAAVIQFVPTVIINEHIFDESVTQTKLKNYLTK
ncbi:MAG: thioredoxin domain-containing protein [Enterococcus sp.]